MRSSLVKSDSTQSETLPKSDTGGHELTPSLASTAQERSIASTTSSGSSCVDSGTEEGDNFLLFLRRFGLG